MRRVAAGAWHGPCLVGTWSGRAFPHGHLSGPKERGASVVTQTDELPAARMPEASAGSRGPATTALLAAALVGSAIAIVAWLDGSPVAGWAWALWVVAFAALLARL